MGFPGGSLVKNPSVNAGDTGNTGLIPGPGRSLRRKWQPTPVLLHEKFHGQRGPMGYSPWSCKEQDMTERAAAASRGTVGPCGCICFVYSIVHRLIPNS